MKRSARTCAVAAMSLTAATLIGSATAHATGGAATATTAAATTSITVQPGAVGNPLRPGFVGISMGAATLAADNFASTDLAGYLRTLGRTGVIRVGGNSGDSTFWTSTGETAPSWAVGTITPVKLQHLAAVAESAHWKVILAVNLKHFDAARAADEAHYAQEIFRSSLFGIEIGNEPNFYYSNTDTYFADFETYAHAIGQAAPGVGLTGPDPDTNHTGFLAAFANNEAAHPDIAAVTHHSYPASVCGNSVATIPELLGTGSVLYETNNALAVVSAGTRLHVPAVMSETNSVVCAGAAGVSDVFAASLWALDYNLLLAQNGVASADFMDGTNAAGCDPYTPLCPTTGDLTARPVFYGMLAASLVGTGDFVSVTNPDAANVRAYAVKDGHHLTVVLDDVQDPSANGPTTVTVDLGATFRRGRETLLATSSPAGLSATTGITLGGSQVGPHGSFAPPHRTTVAVDGQTAVVTIQAGSAAIIEFS